VAERSQALAGLGIIPTLLDLCAAGTGGTPGAGVSRPGSRRSSAVGRAASEPKAETSKPGAKKGKAAGKKGKKGSVKLEAGAVDAQIQVGTRRVSWRESGGKGTEGKGGGSEGGLRGWRREVHRKERKRDWEVVVWSENLRLPFSGEGGGKTEVNGGGGTGERG
jgi:hypothetical protein